MDEKLMKIYKRFNGKLIGTQFMKKHVCEVLALMDEKIVNHITQNCWFFGSLDDAWAFTLTGNDLKDQHLILLSDALLNQSPDQIHFTIAHEIGHVMLNHRNSVLERQNKAEIAKQELEADAFAERYI